jgi:hypothetical protein
MNTFTTYPKVVSVRPLEGKRLLVGFDNGVVKKYDCTDLLQDEAFALLSDEPFFRAARVERGGYAVIWDDRMDVAESELWLNGVEVEAE